VADFVFGERESEQVKGAMSRVYEARPSDKPTPKTEPAVSDPAPTVEPGVEPVLNTYKHV
jgi:hypothetical protein